MKRPTFWFRSDWCCPWGGYNWIDFCLVQVAGEYDSRFGNLEFHVALLGFHFGGQWNVAAGDVEFQAELQQMVREWEQGREHGA